MSKKVLFIVSSAGEIGPKNRKTGNFLPEVAHPYHEFDQKKYVIDFASVQGGDPPIDGMELTEDPLNVSFINGKGLRDMKESKKISEANVKAYDAIFVPGGLGPMVDMPNNKDIQNAIAETYDRGAIVGAVCHGPASLLNVKLKDGSSLIEGKTNSAFSNEEEEGYAKEDVPFLLESAIKEKGAKFVSVSPWQANSIADGRLVTGQNPASAKGVAEKMIALLNAN
ncbi:MAG: type 1 glutamine amidotransferase domain-containing protein [Flammeovirgaceae bacterium]|jgi:putative intracellular protease/amidase|nr:type 1 glutamine amidotransferase domain-containing protein [Flammeovirgaceae bacterium]